jgi:hypothetical protein
LSPRATRTNEILKTAAKAHDACAFAAHETRVRTRPVEDLDPLYLLSLGYMPLHQLLFPSMIRDFFNGLF